jgi:hypothetical protein
MWKRGGWKRKRAHLRAKAEADPTHPRDGSCRLSMDEHACLTLGERFVSIAMLNSC